MKKPLSLYVIVASIFSGVMLYFYDYYSETKDDSSNKIKKLKTVLSYVEKWDCSDPNGIVLAKLAYGQEASITHVKMPTIDKNECSYAYPDNYKVSNVPHSSKVYGGKISSLGTHKKEFMSDLPFPQHDPWSIVIVSTMTPQNPLSKKIASRQFKKEGEVIKGIFKNDFLTRDPLSIVAMYNIPYSQFNEQIGYGGYSISLKVDIDD